MTTKPSYLVPLIIILCIIIYILGRYVYMKPTHINGDIAPNIVGTTAQNQAFDLKNLRGKIVLLDFWGSWCAPCLAQMPHLIDLYTNYANKPYTNAKGFDIVGIGIEENEARWKSTINRLALPWQHQLMDTTTSLRFFDGQFSKRYGVKQVPTTFLLNEDGYIMGVNLTHEEIAKLLEKKIKK